MQLKYGYTLGIGSHACTHSLSKRIMIYIIYIILYHILYVGSQIVAHTQMETGDGPNKPNTINL